MNNEGLDITIGYDIKDPNVPDDVAHDLDDMGKAAKKASLIFTASLEKVEALLESIAISSKQTADILEKNFDRVGRGSNGAGDSAGRAGKKFDNAAKGSDKFRGSMSALNNIVRDAPFGFIAVQNNITQLADSLLGAGKAALIGGFALSLAVTAITQLTQKYGSLAVAFKVILGLESEQERQMRANNAMFKEAAEVGGKELARLEILRSALLALNEPQQERLKALKAYNEVADQANKLGEKDINNTSKINELIGAQIQLIEQRSLARAAEARLAKEADKFLEVQLRTAPVLNKINALYDKQNEAVAESIRLAKTSKQFKAVSPRIATADEAATDPTIQANLSQVMAIRNSSEFHKAERELQLAQEEFQKAIGSIMPFISYDGLTSSDAKEKLKKAVSTLFKSLDLDPINSILNTGRRLDLFIKPQPIDIKQPINIDLVNLPAQMKKAQKQIGEFSAGVKLSAEKVMIDVEGLLQKGVASIASGIGNAIGGILSGAMSLKDGLNSVIGVFADFITQLGEAMIAAGTATLAAKALQTNPFTAIAGGIIAVAAGAAIRASISKAPSFATGGTVFGPQMAMVGDNPARKEHILSDAQLSTIAGGNMREIRVVGEISGSVIKLVYDRYAREQRGVNG